MATSGTYTFRTNRNEIIASALRLVGGMDPEDSSAQPTAIQLTNCSQALNLIIKRMEAVGLQLWERKYGVIFPQLNQQYYALGTPGPGGDHACLSTPLGSGFIRSYLTADAAAGATTVTLESVSTEGTVGVPSISILTTWYIGIQLDDGTMQWTTVDGAPSGTTVTLAAALTGAASSGNVINSYATKLIRPLRVLDGFTRQLDLGNDPSGYNDIPHLILSREEYNRFGSKGSSGVVIQSYYDPQANTGYYYVYPTSQDVANLIYIEYQSPIQDITSATDDYDLPQEWGEYLKFALAVSIAPEYDCPKEKYKQIKEQRDEVFELLDGWDQEDASVYLQPNNWMYNQRWQRK